MKNCIFVALIVSISSNIIASENQNSPTQERSYKSDSFLYLKDEEEVSTPESNHFVPKNKKRNTKSVTSMPDERRPENVQRRLHCFELHSASNHDEFFIQEVINSDNESYSIYQELIKGCTKCYPLFKQHIINSPQN